MAKRASLEFSIAVDSGRVKSNLDQIKGAFVTATSGINASLASIKGFGDLKRQTEEAAKAYAAAQAKVAELAREIKTDAGGKALAKDFEAAKTGADELRTSLTLQQETLQRLKSYVANTSAEYRAAGAALKALRADQDSDAAAVRRAEQQYAALGANLKWIKGEYKSQQQAVKETAVAYKEAGAEVSRLEKALKDGGGNPALAKDFEAAKTEAGRLKQVMQGQQVELQRMRSGMAQTGISTRNLGAEQNRLRAELEQTKTKYQSMAAVANARDSLGVRRHAEIRAEIAKTQAAYKTLAQSGTASAREQAQAWVKMKDKVAELKGQMNGFGQSLGEVKGKLIAAGVGFATWGRGMVGAAQEAIRFEAAFADVKKVVDGSPAQMAALSREIIGLGREIPTAHAGLAQIAAMGGQMGLPVAEIGAFTRAAATMGTAFTIPAEQVGQAIGTMKSIFGLTIPQVVGLGDNINVLGNTMATNEASIIQVLNRIGGSAKLFGLSTEKAAALSAAMLELGQTPEVASTSINTLLTKLQTANVQTPQFREGLESIGLSAEQMAAMVNDKPQQAIDTLLATLGKLNKQDQAEALTKLFGAEYQDNIALLVQGVDSYRKALAAVDDQAKVLGSTEREAAERNKTSEAQLQLLRNTWSEVAINVGNVFLPALNTVVAVLREVTGAVATLTQKYPGLTQALTLAAGAATIFFAAFAARNALMLAFGGSIMGVVNALKQLGPGLVEGVKGLKAIGAEVTTLKGALGSLSGLLLAWEFGQWVGQWLGSFAPIQKGMADLIYGADRARLAVMKLWAQLTGGDVDAVEQKIEIAKQAHADLIQEIENKGKPKPETAPAPERQQIDPAEDEQAKNDAIMKANEDAVAKMRKDDEAAAEAKKQKEIEAAEQAAEARRKLSEEEASRTEAQALETPPMVEQVQPIRRVVEQQTEIQENVSTNAETERQLAEQAGAEREEREVKIDEARQQRQEAAKQAAEQAAERERELLDHRSAEAEKAAAEEADRLSQLQAEQAKATEERMAREQAATEKAKGIFERYADRVKTLQDEIAGREQSLKDDLAEMDPNADEETKWRRRAAEAKNYEKAAKAAQQAGNLEEAKSLADQAREAYKSLGSGATGIDPETAKRMAFAGIKSAGTLGLDLAKMLPDALKQATSVDLSKVEGLSSQAASMLGSRMDSMAGDSGGDKAKPTQVHEIRLGKASLQGSPADVSEFLRQLELAGMTA